MYSPLSNRTHPRPNNVLPLLPLRPALPLLRSLSNLLPGRPALEAANRRSRLLGILVGNLLGLAGVVMHSFTIFARQIASTPGMLIPERGLPPMIASAVLPPIGLFWFGWTSHPGTPWPAQVVAGIPVGAAMFVIFIQGFKYVADVYLEVANSAISANTFMCSFFGAGFPLFAKPCAIFWASTGQVVWGFLDIAMAPVPVVFYIWGSKIRSWSRVSMS